jgi:serine/threonine-protein kinase RsbW
MDSLRDIDPNSERPAFPGRGSVVERLRRHAAGGSGPIVLAGAPHTGTSTLLRRVVADLRETEPGTLPIYFEFDRRDRDPIAAADRFARAFISQTVTARRAVTDDGAGITLAEAADLATPDDRYWVQRAVRRLEQSPDSADLIFATPMFAAAAGVRPFIIFDGLHNTLNYRGGDELVASLLHVAAVFDFPHVFGGRRRFVSNLGPFTRVNISDPMPSESRAFVEQAAAAAGLVSDPASADLLIKRVGCRPGLIETVIRRAASEGMGLEDFRGVVRAYADALFGDEVGRMFDREIAFGLPAENAERVVSALAEHIAAGRGLIPIPAFRHAAGLADDKFAPVIERLNVSEIVRVTSGRIEPMREDQALADYLSGRHRLEKLGERRASVIASSMSSMLVSCPQMMAEGYRAGTALGLRELLMDLNGSEVPAALFSSRTFNEEYKGLSDGEMLRNLSADKDRVKLPFIVFSADIETLDPKIAEAVGSRRAAFATGFAEGTYHEEDRVCWIATEVNAKLAANRETAEEWHARLQASAKAGGLKECRVWLIAPEGFDDDADAFLTERGIFNSSRKQVEMLKQFLSNPVPADVPEPRDEVSNYEIVIPMGTETELIAAHTLEEIAKRHGFKSRDINQIKTALVEACINAAEHSHSPDQRIHQKFSVGRDNITITITNRGVRLVDAPPAPIDSTRRGWGLQLIEKLMDDVVIARTDDGTSISMMKRLQPA